MTDRRSNRRQFLRAAGISVAGLSLARNADPGAGAALPIGSTTDHPVPAPFPSLPSVFEGPRSRFFGVKAEERDEPFGDGRSGRRRKLAPRDPGTLYRADGLSGEEEPHSFQLTFEVTNNRILCSATQSGLLKHPCVFSRMVPARRRGRDRVSEELVGGSPWGFGLLRDGSTPLRLPMTHSAQVELLGAVFPLFSYRVDDLSVQLVAFAPRLVDRTEAPPRALLALVKVENLGSRTWEGSLLAPGLPDATGDAAISTPVESPHPRFTELSVPIAPGYEAVMCLDDTRWDPRCPAVRLSLGPGASAVHGFALLLGTSPVDVQRTRQSLVRSTALDWWNETWRASETRYGRLSVPSEPYFSESPIRLIEADSSAVLYSGEGRLFTGGPSGWVDYGMLLFEPRFLADLLRSLAGYRRRASGPPDAEALADSLVNSLGLLPSAATYYRATDDRELFRQSPGILEFARERLADLLALRKGAAWLFPSKRLWDGPTLGDYHTGSNIVAWLAFHGMGRIARDVYGDTRLGEEWLDVARKIRSDVYRHCVGDSRLGRRFVEGGNADGTFAAGHDGEEAFTTLAPFFGFCEADDPALIHHAKLAFTPDNPLYEPAVDGIWWGSRADRFSGVTTPGQMAMLVANSDEGELARRLDQLRSLTDLDGSIWWWPYLYPCNDRLNVRRRDWPVDTSKSGFTMAIAACLLVNNVFGLSVDAPDRRVSLRPFCPWDEYSWQGAKLGHSVFDVAYRKENGRIVGRLANRNERPYEGLIELVLPKGRAPRRVSVNGKPEDGVPPTVRFGRPSVRISAPVAPGASVELVVEAG